MVVCMISLELLSFYLEEVMFVWNEDKGEWIESV